MAGKKDKDAPQDAYDDFGIVASGSASRFSADTFNRIVGFLTAKGDEVRKAFAAGMAVATPVTIPADTDRSTRANTAWDYLEPLRDHAKDLLPAGKVLGSKWQKDGEVLRLTLRTRTGKQD